MPSALPRYIALFCASEQTHYSLLVCDSEWVAVALLSVFYIYSPKWLQCCFIVTWLVPHEVSKMCWGSDVSWIICTAHGPAHNPRASNYCAAPPCEAGGNEPPEGRELVPLEGEGELNERMGHTVLERDNDELNAETRHWTPILRSVYLLYPKSFNSWWWWWSDA